VAKADKIARAKALAAEFRNAWDAQYPECEPIGYLLKHAFGKRWVRVHSLPGGKRYPTTKPEWDELLDRQNRLIEHVVPSHTPIYMVVNSTSPDNYIFASFDLASIGSLRDGDVRLPSYVFVTTWETHTLNPLLTMIAEDVMRAFIVTPHVLIAPYDGGVDVIARDVHEAGALKRTFHPWLSPRSDGC